jgi:thymidylate synthase ThyX
MAQDPWGDSFTPEEQALLAPFVTSIEAPIFGLRNLPEVVKGALFSRYSRTDKSLRRVLLDEFIAAPEAGFAAIVGEAPDAGAQLVAVREAEAFYERVLIGYGDDSVAELGGAHVAVEGVSNVVAKLLEDSRLGIDPLEKSTRYVPFARKLAGRYRYYREPALLTSPLALEYEAALDGLFDAYSALLEPVAAFVRARNPRDGATSERAYASATRAKALDLLRGLLPMATLTNVGLFGNGRAFEYLLTKLYASELHEARAVASALHEALDALIPSFVKRARSPRGQAHQEYLRATRHSVAALAARLSLGGGTPEQATVRLLDYERDAEERVLANILYPHSNLPLDALRAHVAVMDAEARLALLRAYVGERTVRFHKPGRAFEEPYYHFELLADLGAYRDLQRHRVLTQERQRYGVRHGYLVPEELEQAGLAERFTGPLERAAALVLALEETLPEQAQYAVPLAFRVRWRVKLNLREAYHLLELRSAPQGHPSYRRVAQEMYRLIGEVHPALAEGMRFVDMSDYALERLGAEQRLDAKQAARARSEGFSR